MQFKLTDKQFTFEGETFREVSSLNGEKCYITEKDAEVILGKLNFTSEIDQMVAYQEKLLYGDLLSQDEDPAPGTEENT